MRWWLVAGVYQVFVLGWAVTLCAVAVPVAGLLVSLFTSDPPRYASILIGILLPVTGSIPATLALARESDPSLEVEIAALRPSLLFAVRLLACLVSVIAAGLLLAGATFFIYRQPLGWASPMTWLPTLLFLSGVGSLVSTLTGRPMVGIAFVLAVATLQLVLRRAMAMTDLVWLNLFLDADGPNGVLWGRSRILLAAVGLMAASAAAALTEFNIRLDR